MSLFDQEIYQPKNKSILRLIKNFEGKYDGIFTKVKIQWLPAIREFLREETGLRMHQKVSGIKFHKDTSINFKFVRDREDTFIKLVDKHFPNLDFDEYIAFNKLYVELLNSRPFFSEGLGSPFGQYEELLTYLTQYFKKYDLNILLNTLFKESGRTADIWGTYFYNDCRIEIYYLPLILFSQLNNVLLEHAILSTLVHEIAHAYHNVGKDKDNVIWTKMPVSDKRIVEGMAEYFTWLFVEEYKNHHPGMEKAYTEMFNCLADEYTCFKNWTPTFSKETIKSALLSTRKKLVTDYDEFLWLLGHIKKIMH